jgi:6-phosphogluconolactonase
MKTDTQLSRRSFLQSAGCAASLGMLNGLGASQSLFLSGQKTGFAYVSSAVTSQIHVFAFVGNRWALCQSLKSKAPSFLVMHPNRRYLYAANDIDEHHGLPCGTVEAYKINHRDGQLTLLNTQPLSLSGIKPRHLAISPDGKNLVVAIYGGGAYNVLPISPSGEAGRPTAILKEIGSGLHPKYQQAAHPHTVLFDRTGKYVLGTDQGCDRLNVFALSDGKLVRNHQVQLRRGAGASSMAMHGSRLYVFHASDAAISVYYFDSSTGKIDEEICCVKASSDKSDIAWNRSALAITSAGDFLYASAANGASAWKIDLSTGGLSHIQTWKNRERSLHALCASPDNRGWIAVDSDTNSVIYVDLDDASRELSSVSELATVTKPSSVVIG